MATSIFRYGRAEVERNDIDWSASTIKVILCKSGMAASAAANNNTWTFLSALPAAKLAGSTDKVKTLTTTIDEASNGKVYLKATASSVTFPTVSVDTIESVVVYASVGTTSASPLLACLDFTTNQASNGGEFTVNWNANGLIQLSFGA